MEKPPDDLLTPRDVQRRLRISRSTLRSQRYRKGLPRIQMSSRLIRYRRSDVEAFVASHRVGPG